MTARVWRDEHSVAIACALLTAQPERYLVREYGMTRRVLDAGALAHDAEAILSRLPEAPAGSDPDRVRPDWGDNPAGFR